MTRQTEEFSIRKQKLTASQQAGFEPYPARVNRSQSINEVVVNFNDWSAQGKIVAIVGRLKAIRLHGGSCFMHLQDGTNKIQVYFKKDKIGEAAYKLLKEQLDVGDFIQCTGSLFNTKKGEPTIMVKTYNLIAKALLPLPEKWHGLSNTETRYRQRYLDLIANPEVVDIFKKRARILKTIRHTLDEAGFLEVETPVLQPVPGGANARPFITHHHALNHDFYLRIAPELYLKRLIIGGLEKVYEISRCFRNEGIDRDHNPEFTQVEFYAAYWDYERMMEFTERFFVELVRTVEPSLQVPHKKSIINFHPPYKRLTFFESCRIYAKIDIRGKDDKTLREDAQKRGLTVDHKWCRAKILDEIFKELVRPQLIQPVFITDHPLELSPLAKKKPDNPRYVERFQLLVGATELCNAFSELNDPIEQTERFQRQEAMRQAGDDEAQRVDRDYINALSYGMPPTAGIGIGIDRLVSLLTNQPNLKEVILFPTLKPKQHD